MNFVLYEFFTKNPRLSPLLIPGAMMFQYYIKIVPTEFVPLSGPKLHTNQFSVTTHRKSVSLMSGDSGMPGIFVNYELSPLMVKFTEKRRLGVKFTLFCVIF